MFVKEKVGLYKPIELKKKQNGLLRKSCYFCYQRIHDIIHRKKSDFMYLILPEVMLFHVQIAIEEVSLKNLV